MAAVQEAVERKSSMCCWLAKTVVVVVVLMMQQELVDLAIGMHRKDRLPVRLEVGLLTKETVGHEQHGAANKEQYVQQAGVSTPPLARWMPLVPLVRRNNLFEASCAPV